MSRVFISHSEEDQDAVRSLVRLLQVDGHEVADHGSMISGKPIARVLTDAIEGSDYVLVVLSPAYLESSWAQKELELAIAGRTERGRTLIPLMFRKCDLPPSLKGAVYIDFTYDFSHGATALRNALKTVKQKNVDYGIHVSPSGAILSTNVAVARHASVDQVGRDQVMVQGGSAAQTQEFQQLVAEMRRAVKEFKKEPESQLRKPRPVPPSGQDLRCFVVMPFGHEDLEVVYEDFVKPTLEIECRLIRQPANRGFNSPGSYF